MLISNVLDFGIPTSIRFTLYRFDYIDSIIISNVLTHCKNWNAESNDLYTVSADSFKTALLSSKRLKTEILKTETVGLTPSPDNKPNSIYFLWYIINRLPNLMWLNFDVSYDKNFSRLIGMENKEILNFYFKIDEGVFDLTKIFDRSSLDIINKKVIEYEIIENSYLDRTPYFYVKTSVLFEILGQLEIEGALNTFEVLDKVDPKLEEDDPLLLVITDYTEY